MYKLFVAYELLHVANGCPIHLWSVVVDIQSFGWLLLHYLSKHCHVPTTEKQNSPSLILTNQLFVLMDFVHSLKVGSRNSSLIQHRKVAVFVLHACTERDKGYFV